MRKRSSLLPVMLQLALLIGVGYMVSFCTSSKSDTGGGDGARKSVQPVDTFNPTPPGSNNSLVTSTEPCPTYIVEPNMIQRLANPENLTTFEGLPKNINTLNPALDPYGFECFGACGPSCKAMCLQGPQVTKTYLITKNGQQGYKKCMYSITKCRSSSVCRAHDECYRRSDVDYMQKWGPTASPPSTFSTMGYRLCDLGPFSREVGKLYDWYNTSSMQSLTDQQRTLCWAYYMAGTVPDGNTGCWDNTYTNYATFLMENTVTPADVAGAIPINL